MKIVCAKCNGVGSITHYTDSGIWSELCKACDGNGILGNGYIDNVNSMDVLISKNALLEEFEWLLSVTNESSKNDVLETIQRIKNAPAVDAVSRGMFEQYKWERDIAIEQLEELGLGLGQKIEGVYLTREEHEKLLEYKYMYEDLCD